MLTFRQWLLNIAHGYSHFSILLFPTLAIGLEADYQRPFGEVIALATPAFAAFGFGALLAGYLGDRYSRHLLLTVFFLGVGGSALAAALSQSLIMLAIALTSLGLFGSIYHPVGTAMVVAGQRRVGRALGINGVFGNFGVASGPLVAGLMLDAFGWRSAFLLCGLIGIVCGLLFARFGKDASDDVHDATETHLKAPRREHLLPILFVIAVTTALGGILFDVMNSATPKLFAERTSLSLANIGLAIGALMMVASAAQFFVGSVIDHRDPKPIFLGLVAARLPCLWLLASADGVLMGLAAFGLMVSTFGEVPVFDTLLARTIPNAWRSRAYAVRNFIGFASGALAVSLVAVTVSSSGGFPLLFMIVFGLQAFGLAVATRLPRAETGKAEMPAE